MSPSSSFLVSLLTKGHKSLRLILPLLAFVATGARDEPPVPEVCFALLAPRSERPPLDEGEGPFTQELLDKNVVLSGSLHDTSVINVFSVHVYDGFRIKANGLYVKDRPLISPYQSVWCEVKARISKVDLKFQDHNEIEIIARKDADMEPIQRGLETACKWVEANRSTIDLNEFRKGEPVRKVRYPIPADDLNRKPYRIMKKINGVDTKRHVAEFLCGRYVMGEVPNHEGHFLDILAVYDLTKQRIIRVIVDESGYFLE